MIITVITRKASAQVKKMGKVNRYLKIVMKLKFSKNFKTFIYSIA